MIVMISIDLNDPCNYLDTTLFCLINDSIVRERKYVINSIVACSCRHVSRDQRVRRREEENYTRR